MKQSGRRGFLNCCLALRLNCTIDAKILLWIQVLAVHIVQIVYIIGIPSHVHSTALISGAEVFHRNDCTHTHTHTRSICIYIVFERVTSNSNQSIWIENCLFCARILWNVFCAWLWVEFNLTIRAATEIPNAMSNDIPENTATATENCILYTIGIVMVTAAATTQHWCLLQMSRIHVVDTQHTNNQCVQTHLNA